MMVRTTKGAARGLVWLVFAAVLGGGFLAGGCAAPARESVVIVLPGEYPAAFDAAREALIEQRFDLERVDASAGVITTQPRETAGLATPWDQDQSTFRQEWEDFTNQQQRVARITFAPEADDDAVAPDQALPDRRTDPRPLIARVEVTVLRVRRHGWRPEVESITNSSRARDPELTRRSGGAVFLESVGRDDWLAGRIAGTISAALSGADQPDVSTEPGADPNADG